MIKKFFILSLFASSNLIFIPKTSAFTTLFACGEYANRNTSWFSWNYDEEWDKNYNFCLANKNTVIKKRDVCRINKEYGWGSPSDKKYLIGYADADC